MHLRFFVALLALPLGGCGLFLDTSPPDQAADGGPSCEVSSDCDDGLACTVDSCVNGACAHAREDARCEAGDICAPVVGCVTPCDDASDCGALDLGECGFGHCTFVTDELGYCTRRLDDDVCGDAFGCTDDVCSESGECTSVPSDANCDDELECTVDVCDPSNTTHDADGCGHTPSDALCADDFACTVDLCLPGHDRADVMKGCVHVPDDTVCADAHDAECTASVCTPALGCQLRVFGAECESGQHCDLATGSCAPLGVCEEDADCSDGNPCNGVELCETGMGFCYLAEEERECPFSGDECLEAFCEPISVDLFACEVRLAPFCYDVPLPP
jgi:hypothetical protein